MDSTNTSTNTVNVNTITTQDGRVWINKNDLLVLLYKQSAAAKEHNLTGEYVSDYLASVVDGLR